MSKMSKKIICITGSIGSGKSSVSQYLVSKGYPVLDLDEVVKKLYKRADIIKTVNKKLFQKEDNNLDLKEVADIIFKNEEKREWLESYLYPIVKQEMDLFILKYEICFVEMALVFEKGWEKYFTEVLCVYTEKEIAKKRLIQYREFKNEEIEYRMNHQLDPIIKLKRSDVVIINNNDKDELYKKIDQYLAERGL